MQELCTKDKIWVGFQKWDIWDKGGTYRTLREGGGVLLYLSMVWRFRGDDPHSWDFQSDWIPILYLHTLRITPLSAEKIGLSPSHLDSEIFEPKVGIIFHQNVLFTEQI